MRGQHGIMIAMVATAALVLLLSLCALPSVRADYHELEEAEIKYGPEQWHRAGETEGTVRHEHTPHAVCCSVLCAMAGVFVLLAPQRIRRSVV